MHTAATQQRPIAPVQQQQLLMLAGPEVTDGAAADVGSLVVN